MVNFLLGGSTSRFARLRREAEMATAGLSSSIVAKSNLAFGTLAAPAVGGLAELSTELLRSFPKETHAATVRLLAFDRTDSSPGVNA